MNHQGGSVPLDSMIARSVTLDSMIASTEVLKVQSLVKERASLTVTSGACKASYDTLIKAHSGRESADTIQDRNSFQCSLSV
jgi:hypothetical protein